MDISKLEALACLKLDPLIKDEVASSLNEVVKNLQEVTHIKIENKIENQKEDVVAETVFRKQEFSNPEINGLNITEDGYFLAPKVIKKD